MLRLVECHFVGLPYCVLECMATDCAAWAGASMAMTGVIE